MSKKTFIVSILSILLLLPLTVKASEAFPPLSPEELTKLRAYELIMETRPVKDAPWPEVTFWRLIDATPGECAAVFSAYPDQVNYSPNLVEALPLKQVTSTDVHVSFKMNMPWPVSDTVTVTGNRLSRLEDGTYRVEWYLVKSDSSKESRGSARFSPYNGKTVYRYRSFNFPTSSLSRLIKGKMIKSTGKSVLAYIAYLEKVKKKNPVLMKRYITRMNRALNGEKIY